MFNSQFWQSSIETAVRAAAAAALGVIGTDQLISAVAVSWSTVAGVALLASVVSILTSIAVPNPDIRAARAAARAQAEAEAVAAAKKQAATATKKSKPARAPRK